MNVTLFRGSLTYSYVYKLFELCLANSEYSINVGDIIIVIIIIDCSVIPCTQGMICIFSLNKSLFNVSYVPDTEKPFRTKHLGILAGGKFSPLFLTVMAAILLMFKKSIVWPPQLCVTHYSSRGI